ncbi:MAG TPA: transcriptional repressor LexA [Candidatus Cryosericum sp.]|nr:transcriptional repressor LexA [Candidatus Cryosericum sp.]
MLPTRRQKAVLDAIQEHIAESGRPPTLQEIARRCGLSSVATVHRHIALLQERGLLKRRRSRRRGIEVKAAARRSIAVELPLAGSFGDGGPIEALPDEPTVVVPRLLVRRPDDTFVLRVRGESMREEQILEGDLVVVERRDRAEDGEVVVALLEGRGAVLRTMRRERGRVRLQAANPALDPIEAHDSQLRIQGIVTGLFRRFP